MVKFRACLSFYEALYNVVLSIGKITIFRFLFFEKLLCIRVFPLIDFIFIDE